MDEVGFVDKERGQERKFELMTDLAPLEHWLIDSSVRLKDGSIFNSDRLEKDQALARDAEFLLKPNGLTTNASNLKKIAEKRSEEKKLTGWYPCFKVRSREISSNYDFDLFLSLPSENGLIPNEFRFKLKRAKEDKDDLPIPQDECKRVFDLITLFDTKRGYFSIEKQVDKGVILLKYLPLLENKDK